MLDLRNSESEWFLQDKNTVTLFVLEIEQGTVMSDFADAKRNLISSFRSLHNTPRSLDLVNIPARIRGECIDTFKLSCGFLDFSFFLIVFFKGELVLADRSPPPPLEWISSPPLVAAVLITTKGDESPGSSRMGVIGALVIFSI